MRSIWIIQRFVRFRAELALLWQAFRNPAVPLHLKGLMLVVPLYLLSPIDLIPDFIPVVGLLDDMIIVPLLVSAIVGLVVRHMGAGNAAGMGATAGARPRDAGTIDGSWRRI